MIKEKIRQWLSDNPYEAFSSDLDTKAKMIEQCFNDLQGWVSVDDSLPEEGECVDGYGVISAGYNQGDESRVENIFFNNKKSYWWFINDDIEHQILQSFHITHWRPMPLPPTK